MRDRVAYIDGIRGWAAVVVLLFHLFWETFGARFPEFRAGPMKLFLNGPLAVYVFFVLSGDALATPFVMHRDPEFLARTVARRYFRLTVPILLSCTMVWLLMALSLNFNRAAGAVLGRQDWLGGFLNFEPSLAKMFSYVLIGVFQEYHVETAYNPFLWTMSVELLGSALTLLFLFQMNWLAKPLLVALLAVVLFWVARSYLGLFFVGISLALLRGEGLIGRQSRHDWSAISWLLLTGVAWAVWQQGDVAAGTVRSNTLIVILLVVGLYANRTLRGFFGSKFSLYLGRLSFPIYLVHFAVLISLTSWGVLQLDRIGALSATNAILLGVVTIAFSFVLGHLLAKLEKVASARVYRWLDRWVCIMQLRPDHSESRIPSVPSCSSGRVSPARGHDRR
ncbi:MAG: acyltransferase family protein [Leptothrix sp. (in: b-proteobacteria)]